MVKIGGPAYRIGVGGGAASSMVAGDNQVRGHETKVDGLVDWLVGWLAVVVYLVGCFNFS